MALSIILRRSASRVISGGNRYYGTQILPGASVSSFRQFCSSPSLSSKDVNDAKRPTLNDSVLNDLMSRLQSIQRDIESIITTESVVKGVDAESVVKGFDVDSTVKGKANEDSVDGESVVKGFDVDSTVKGKANEDSNDEGEDSESDDDSNDEGEDSENDEGDDHSSDENDNDSSDEGGDDGNREGGDDSNENLSSESNNEAPSESDDNNEYSDHEPISESNDKSPESNDKSLSESKEYEELLKGIQSEILSAKNFMQVSTPDVITPADFPFKFEEIYYGTSPLFLSREYQGELVEVAVKNPTIYSHDNCYDYNQKKNSSFSMDLTVMISCMNSKSKKVEFKCAARHDGISIYTARDPADGSDNNGVHMSEFNKNLKEEFGKYLEARGITMSTTNFLYRYMLHKANREKLGILQNIQKIVI